MSDVSQEMINRVIAKAGHSVPAYTLKDSTVYVFRVVDGCMRYARKSVVNDASIDNMQLDSFIINHDVDAGKLDIEFMSSINDDEYETTICASVEWMPKPTQIVPFDRFAICQAYFWYLTHYYDGMWSNEYKRLCKMQTYYKPASSERMPNSPESATIYNQLEIRNGYKPTGWMVLSDDDSCNDIVIWDDAD